MAPLAEHFLEEYIDVEEKKPVPSKVPAKRVPRGVPGRRSTGAKRGDVLEQAEAVVRQYLEAEAARRITKALPGAIPVGVAESAGQLAVQAVTGRGGLDKQALLALALEGALIVGASALLATGPGRSLRGALTLEGLLVSVFKSQSTRRGLGQVVRGFRESFRGAVKALATE